MILHYIFQQSFKFFKAHLSIAKENNDIIFYHSINNLLLYIFIILIHKSMMLIKSIKIIGINKSNTFHSFDYEDTYDHFFLLRFALFQLKF